MNNLKKFILRRGLYSLISVTVLLVEVVSFRTTRQPIYELSVLRIAVPTSMLMIASLLNSIAFFISFHKYRSKNNGTYRYFKDKRPKVLKILFICFITLSTLLYGFNYTVTRELIDHKKINEENMVSKFQYTDIENKQINLDADTSDASLDVFLFFKTYGVESALNLISQENESIIGEEIVGKFEYLNGVPSILMNRFIGYYEDELVKIWPLLIPVKSKTNGDVQIKYSLSNFADSTILNVLFYTENDIWYGFINTENSSDDIEQYVDILLQYFKANLDKGLNYGKQ